MKNVKIVFDVTVILLAFAGCNFSNQEQKNEPLKIGAILPLTGNSAVWGVPTKEGIELAVDLLNRNSSISGRKIDLIFEDTKGDPATATSSINKLISVDKVVAVIDNSNSSVTLAVAPIVEKNKIPLLVTGASSPKIKDAGDYVFRIWNSDALEGEYIANYSIDSLNLRNISVLFVNNNYGVGLKDVFIKSFERRGGNIVREETFEETANDFRTQCSKVLSTDCDALYLVCYPKQGAILLKQLKELGNKKLLLGAVAFEDPDLIKNAGEASNGLIYPLPFPGDTLLDYYQQFKSAYIAKFNKPVPFLAAEGFDGLNVLIQAIGGKTNITPEEIKNRLYNINDYKGVSGLINFDSFGEVHKPFGIRKISNQKVIWLYNKLYYF